jgi:NADP-dependent 3-hydroxy acid dehydrogenase YdfG
MGLSQGRESRDLRPLSGTWAGILLIQRIFIRMAGIRVGAVAPGMVLNELWGLHDESEINRRAELGEGLRSADVAEAVLFMLTRPSDVTIRDLVMLPRAQDL